MKSFIHYNHVAHSLYILQEIALYNFLAKRNSLHHAVCTHFTNVCNSGHCCPLQHFTVVVLVIVLCLCSVDVRCDIVKTWE